MAKKQITEKPENKALGIVKAGNKIDLLATLEVIKAKLNQLNKISAQDYKTPSFLTIPVHGQNIKIQEELDQGKLVMAASKIRTEEDAYIKTQNTMSKDLAKRGLKAFLIPVYKYKDSSYNDIYHDVILRIEILTKKERKIELEEAKRITENFLSDGDKQTLAMEKVSDLLGQ